MIDDEKLSRLIYHLNLVCAEYPGDINELSDIEWSIFNLARDAAKQKRKALRLNGGKK